MYGLESLLLMVGVLLLIAPVLAIVALVKASNLRYEVTRLYRLMREMQNQIAELREGAAPAGGPAAPEQARPAPPVPEKSTPSARVTDEAPHEKPAPDEQPQESPAKERAGANGPETPAPKAPPPPRPESTGRPSGGPFRKPKSAGASQSLEEKFFRHWFLIIAAVAFALSAVFLVRHAQVAGWLTPTIQCLLGGLLGLSLIGAGEFLRRHPIKQAAAFVRPSLVSPALSAAGVSALFVSIYAAYALYQLLSAGPAFIGLFIVWIAAMALSLVQGPFVAALGILGGFAVPILVQTGHPSAWGLFPYVLAVNGAALGVLRYKGWGWLAWGTLAGATGWPFLWLVGQPATDLGAPVIGAYLTATAALFMYLPAGLKPHESPLTLKHMFARIPLPAVLAWTASTLMLGLALLLAWADGFGWGSVTWAGVLAAFVMFAGRRDVTFDALSIVAATTVALILLTWDLPYWGGGLDILETLPPELVPFVLTAASYAVLFGIGGFWFSLEAARPGLWAGLSAGAPVITLAIAFARVTDFEVDLAWATAGLVLAGLNLGAAIAAARRHRRSGGNGALAAYAVGVVASLSLAMAMSLENAWLTVTLSLQLPAVAWIHERTRVDPLRAVAALIAGIVLTRLVFNPAIFEYGLTATPGLNWMFYGYGIPTLAFYAAARMFRRSADDRLVLALESGALVFLTLFCTMEIADIVQQGAFQPGDSLLEASLRSIAWLSISLALLYQCRAKEPRLVAFWGWQILALLSGGHIATVQLFGLNPLLFGGSVGSLWIFNLLLLAYGIPAAFAALFLWETARQRHPSAPAIAGVSALVLTFVWISLEVRHAFHGSWLSLGLTSDLEWYAYSATWVLYGATLLVLGIWRDNQAIRNASLVVLLISTGKVFLFDMSEISDLFRFASFLFFALIITLLHLLYSRFVKGGTETQDKPESG